MIEFYIKLIQNLLHENHLQTREPYIVNNMPSTFTMYITVHMKTTSAIFHQSSQLANSDSEVLANSEPDIKPFLTLHLCLN